MLNPQVQESITVPTIRRFLWGATLILLAIVGQLLLSDEYMYAGGAALLGSACLFTLVFRARSIDTLSLKIDAAGWRTPHDWIAIGAVVGSVILAVVAWIILDVHEPSSRFWTVYTVSLSVIVFVPLALVLYDGSRTGVRDWRTWLWLASILAVAATVRLAGLSSLPFGTWYDEAANGLEALRVLNEPQYRPVYTDGVNASGHYLYLIVAAFKLFGIDTQSIRLISVMAGVVTVGAAYVGGREFFGRNIGLVLAFMMAVSRWSVNFSRLGMYNALTPMFEFLAIAFLVRGLKRNRLQDYILAGVSIGFGFCYYAAFQLFVAALALFLLYVVVSKWAPGTRFWLGMLVMALSALVVIAPLAKYAYERPESYFARVQDTSIFSDKEPDERIPALAENLRKHLLMFNVRGDPNGRHNLPGEPMLDPVTAALFVFGIALCLSRIRRPFSVMLLSWFIIALMGGVLSLDFEAPQSLRSIATMPAVYMLAVVPLYVLQQEWAQEGGRYYPGAVIGLIGLLLLPSAAFNIDTYFRRQAQDFASWNAFSTPETLTAQYLRVLSPSDSVHVISLYDKHPTLRFLAREEDAYQRLSTTASLPIVEPSDGDLVLIMDAERRELYEEALRVYPGAHHEEIQAPFGSPVVLYYVNVPYETRLENQGFTGVYTSVDRDSADVIQKDLTIDFVWPEEAPLEGQFTAEWTGILAITTYGPYQFGLEAPGAAKLLIDETPVIDTGAEVEDSGAVLLPQGMHRIRVSAASGEGPVRLLWRTPDRETEVLPAWAVFGAPVTNNGLLGRYFPNSEWNGDPALERIEGGFDKYFHIPDLPRPYTIEWSGKVAIPQSGQYGFGLESNDESTLLINGETLAASDGNGGYGEGFVELDAGLHDIVMRYADRSDHTYFKAFWIPPPEANAGVRQILPDAVLFPPQGDYERIAIPSLAELQPSVIEAVGVETSFAATPVETEVVIGGLGLPVGVTSVEAGVIAVFPESADVSMLDRAESQFIEFTQGDRQITEPFDIDADDSGNVYVLDSAAGTIARFDSEARFVEQLPIEPTLLSRARGIGLDGQDGLWIANTPGGQLVRYDLETESVTFIPVKQHLESFGDSQPVDVTVTDDGAIFVTDAGVHKLSRYNDRGMRLWSVDIPVANTLHGAHLIASGHGTVYVTIPEHGSILEYDASGSVVNGWSPQTGGGRIVKPVGIAVDVDGSILVSDVEGRQVLRFETGVAVSEDD